MNELSLRSKWRDLCLQRYERLIETRKKRVPVVGAYYEIHHILPLSMGGNSSEENFVKLTAREHFIAHRLLWMIHRNPAMGFAFSMMKRGFRKRNLTLSSRDYAAMREALSYAMSQRDQHGENNSRWGTNWSKELRENLKSRKVGAFRDKSGALNPRARLLYQYNVHGTLLQTWTNAKECADEFALSRGNISSAAKFNSMSTDCELRRTKNFIFSFSLIDSQIFTNWKRRYSQKKCHVS